MVVAYAFTMAVSLGFMTSFCPRFNFLNYALLLLDINSTMSNRLRTREVHCNGSITKQTVFSQYLHSGPVHEPRASPSTSSECPSQPLDPQHPESAR